jgi:glycosyltransferase involved in cell wall biosynthesis
VEGNVVIVATGGNGSLAGYAQALAASADAPHVVVKGCSGSFGRPLLSRSSLRCLAGDAEVVRRLRRLDAPLLHLTSHHLARFGPFIRRPYIVTVHDLMRHRDWKERGARPPLIHEPNLHDSLHLRLDAAGLRRAAALIAVSEHTRRELIEVLGVPRGRVTVVPEGVDGGAFRPRPGLPLDGPYILYVGSEQPRKNLGTLFRALVRLRERWPGLRLVKVGAPGGPEAPFRESTLHEARKAGALPHVLFADRVSHGELVAWYSGAVCLVQPSRHEGFGLPILEAMACGCPVVASSAGALPEVVGDAGVVYGQPDDVDSLTRDLSRLIASAAERRRLARAGLGRAGQMTWERTAWLTRAVWREVLGQAAPGRLARPAAWRQEAPQRASGSAA